MVSIEFYGVPPDISWDLCTYVDLIVLTHSSEDSLRICWRKGRKFLKARPTNLCERCSLSTPEVRANIDNELVAKSIDFMRRQKNAYESLLPYIYRSLWGTFPNSVFLGVYKGKSQIGNFGDKLMEGDHHVGQISSNAEGTWR